jgi:L-asparaginase
VTALQKLVRPVRLVAAGGTIAMKGEQARPALGGAELVAAIPALAEVPRLEVETAESVPSAQLSLAQSLSLCRRACDAAATGEGVVVTTGTDALEELAMLASLMHEGDTPIAFTGAIRPSSAASADGPGNVLDAIALAGSAPAAGLGVVAVFGGEVHSGHMVRKVDSISPSAFGSPHTGPIGRMVELAAWIAARPVRPPTVRIDRLRHRVDVVAAGLGDTGDLLSASLASGADGIVAVALGAGHVPPGFLRAMREAAARIPVVVTARPSRSALLHATYGFEGSERDVRASGAIPAGFLSPQAARIALLAALGASLGATETLALLSHFDA